MAQQHEIDITYMSVHAILQFCSNMKANNEKENQEPQS